MYCYGFEALTGVYLGAALTEAEKDVVGQLLHGSLAKLCAMERSNTNYSVQAQSLDYTPYGYPSSVP